MASNQKPEGEHIEFTSEDEKQARIRRERDSVKPESKTGRFFSKLGDLPEWRLGKRRLHGKALNYAIGGVASTGFLMFGYDQGRSAR